MTTYGYIRTSRDQEPGHPGSDPEVRRCQLAGVAVFGTMSGNSSGQWHLLDQLLAQRDVLVMAAVNRLGLRYLETMWAIYDLQRRGIRLRFLADSEIQWTKYLDADPDSPEAFMGNVLASMAAYVASQERQNISRRTRAGLQAARDKGVELGRPRRLTNFAAHCHQAGRGGRDARGSGGPEVWIAQVQRPHHPGADSVKRYVELAGAHHEWVARL